MFSQLSLNKVPWARGFWGANIFWGCCQPRLGARGGPSQLPWHQTCVPPPQLLLAPAQDPGGHFCAKSKFSYSWRHVSSSTLPEWPSTQYELLQGKKSEARGIWRTGAQLEGWKPYPTWFCSPCPGKLPEQSGTKPNWPHVKYVFTDNRVVLKYL